MQAAMAKNGNASLSPLTINWGNGFPDESRFMLARIQAEQKVSKAAFFVSANLMKSTTRAKLADISLSKLSS